MGISGTTNETELYYVKETTAGVTPATPSLQQLRNSSVNLQPNTNNITSTELLTGGMVDDIVRGVTTVSGEFSGELSYGTWDDMFPSLIWSDWVETGTTISGATDIGSDTSGFLTSTTTDFTAQSYTVGQYVKVEGFTDTTLNKHYRIIALAATQLDIEPVPTATVAAGDSVTITPLDFIRNGSTSTSFTFQVRYTDTAAVTYDNYTGVHIGSMTFPLAVSSLIPLSFTANGFSNEITETQFSGAVDVAKNTSAKMRTGDDITDILIDGVESSEAFTEISLNVDNGQREKQKVNSSSVVDFGRGNIVPVLTLSMYFDSKAEKEKFLANASFSFSTQIKDLSDNTYIITIPKCKYQTGNISVNGNNNDLMMEGTAEGIAYNDGTNSYNIQISRT